MEKSRKRSIWRVSVFLLFGLLLIGATVLSGQVATQGKGKPIPLKWHVTFAGDIQGGPFTQGLDSLIQVNPNVEPTDANPFYEFSMKILAPKQLYFSPITIADQWTAANSTGYSGTTKFPTIADPKQAIADFINSWQPFPDPNCIPYGYFALGTTIVVNKNAIAGMNPGETKPLTAADGYLGFNFNSGIVNELHDQTPFNGVRVTKKDNGWEFTFSQGIQLQEDYLELVSTKGKRVYVTFTPQMVLTTPVYFTVTWKKY